VPLGLALCIPTKNTAPVIAAGIRSFTNTARSRDFDCVQLRTDGEGALAAMSEELSGLGIVLDVAGPGQHVPVVERKIQTIKERVRAHKNSLPYIMTRLMLTMCVLFCVSRLNMQLSRMSVNRTSPLEQFTGYPDVGSLIFEIDDRLIQLLNPRRTFKYEKKNIRAVISSNFCFKVNNITTNNGSRCCVDCSSSSSHLF
jgi:hypothetical protein